MSVYELCGQSLHFDVKTSTSVSHTIVMGVMFLHYETGLSCDTNRQGESTKDDPKYWEYFFSFYEICVTKLQITKE